MHHLLVRHVAVGEDDLVEPRPADVFEPRLVDDWNAVGIERASQGRRIAAPADAGDLGRREGDHFERRVVAIDHVEIVEVAARGAENDDASPCAFRCSRCGSGRSH